MAEAAEDNEMDLTNLAISDLVAAAGALGTASFALVDACKLFGGGVSNCGFSRIMTVVRSLVPDNEAGSAWHASLRSTLRANWLNGTALVDQKAIAKTLIKLRLDATTAPAMAGVTGMPETALTAVAAKVASGTTLSEAEHATFGCFDLIVTAMLDEAYQRADQIYRNSAKTLSIAVSVVLAIIGVLVTIPFNDHEFGAALLQAFVLGLIASPLAPVSKDLSSALAAGVKVAQTLRK